jgi:hypothetical protein
MGGGTDSEIGSDVTVTEDLIAKSGPVSAVNRVHMHPQASDKRTGNFRPFPPRRSNAYRNAVVCKEFFEALGLCHANVWAKWTGGCNQAKRELNKCLHNDVRPASETIPFSAHTSRV